LPCLHTFPLPQQRLPQRLCPGGHFLGRRFFPPRFFFFPFFPAASASSSARFIIPSTPNALSARRRTITRRDPPLERLTANSSKASTTLSTIPVSPVRPRFIEATHPQDYVDSWLAG